LQQYKETLQVTVKYQQLEDRGWASQFFVMLVQPGK